jgi:nucleoside-diphosphate-sugar epimerase
MTEPLNSSLKILFIGGTGTISKAVLELASKLDVEISILNRGNRLNDIPREIKFKFIQGDIREHDNIKRKLENLHFDIVVDWIAYNPQHILNDISLFGENLKQYIFISSASVYEKPLKHYIVTENTPINNPFWKYSQDKIECEKLLLNEFEKNKFPITIVRPSHTYYKTISYIFNSKTHPWTLIDRLQKGKKIIVPGDGTSLWTLTHAKDFARGFIGLLNNSNAIGQSFHITSDEVLTWNSIVATIAEAIGVVPNIIHIPSDSICHYFPEYAGSLIGDKSNSIVFDNSKIKKYVPNFCSKISFKKGIEESIKWYMSKHEMCSIDYEFNEKMDNIIKNYESLQRRL